MSAPSWWDLDDGPRWDVEGRDWPHREASEFIELDGARWHVQRWGRGPTALLLHGAGAASHSFRGLAPILARDFSVVVPDLPGHGFTRIPPGRPLGLPAMADGVAALMRHLESSPRLIVGHSAGAAVAARALLDRQLKADLLVGVNAALLPLRGWSATAFAPMAKAVIASRIGPRMLAYSASRGTSIQRTIEGTGSVLDGRGYELYRRLVRRPGHVEGTVRMMSEWNLDPLVEDLTRLPVPLLLLFGLRDRAVPPADARSLAHRVPRGEAIGMPGLGHLSHEEDPVRTAALILEGLNRIESEAVSSSDAH